MLLLLIILPVVIFAIVLLIIFVVRKNRTHEDFDQQWHESNDEDFFHEQKKYRSEQIGQEGENWIASVLGQDIPDEKYVINNLTISSGGKSSQIDHIMITKVGIFLIETKNYSGTIYGSLNQRQWTQVFDYGKVKNSFYNPTMQSNTHAYRLKRVLGRLAKSNCFVQTVVFPKAELMIEPIDNVGDTHNLVRILNTPREYIFTTDEINRIHRKLIDFKINPRISEDKHIQNIQKTQLQIAHNICPRCNSKLVLRNGQYGSFYGCKKYPYCKFKKHV